MDPRYCAQDVVRCALCRDAVAPMYCSVCRIHLCGDCVEKHFSDKLKVHNVVPLEQILSTLNHPNCSTHLTKQCELHCEQCDISICTSCISSGKHIGHKQVDILEAFESKKEVLRRDLEELEKFIFPKYQESAAFIKTQKTDHRKHIQKLIADVNNQGDLLLREVNNVIQKKQSEIDEMDKQHRAAVEKEEDSINKAINEIEQVILYLKSLLDTCDVGLVSKYRSRSEEFRKLPSKLKISIPDFSPTKINREQLMSQLGSFTPLSTPLSRSLLDVPSLITDIPTTGYDSLYNVSCVSDEEIWTSGNNEIMRLYNLQGDLLKSVQTKSGNKPWDIAVTKKGNLLYVDYNDRSINIVSDTHAQGLIKFLGKKSDTKITTLVTLRGWRPLYLCSASSGDLLVIMDSDDNKQAKVVRYTGSTQTQTIQKDDNGKPLYTSSGYKYLSENRNLDICVADRDANAVVVVNAAGKLRFRYTGSPFITQELFHPFGITTDSQAKILTSDYYNHCVHILDQDGQFLFYINNCDLHEPFGLCVDSTDNVFVAETSTCKIKKLHYYK